MSFLELLRISFHTIKANKLRTILSMIGIVIGTMTIALVTAIWWGVEQAVEDQFKTLSVNNLFVAPDGEDSEINTDDTEILLKSKYVKSASANIDGSFQVSNSVNTNVEKHIVQWVKENYFEQFNMELDVGKLFPDGDVVDKVAVIWVNVADDLFEVDDPKDTLWETVTIKSKKFRVIGVLKEVWVSFWPFSYDDTVYLPIWTTKRYLIKGNLTSALSMVIDDVENMEAAKEEIWVLLRKEYNVKKDDTDWFLFIDAGATIGIATDVAKILSFLLVGISVIILIVSGIWIMNVMFAWVAERTKEIGILKSLWATQSEIKKQFLLESIMITILSWLVGVLLAEMILTVAIYFEAPISRSLRWDILALWFAIVTGVLSWRYPAARAAKMDPVDALRG